MRRVSSGLFIATDTWLATIACLRVANLKLWRNLQDCQETKI